MSKSKPLVSTTRTESKVILAGEEAVDTLKKTYEHWVAIARAMNVGRIASLRAAELPLDTPRGQEGGGYSRLFGAWLNEHPKLRLGSNETASKTIRSWLYKCLDHEAAIYAWRTKQGPDEWVKYSFPETVFKRWAKAEGYEDPDAKPKRKKKDKKTEDQRVTDQVRQRIKNMLDEDGDWDHDTAEQIAEKVTVSHPAKAEEVAIAILGEDRPTLGGLDWDAPEGILVVTLFEMLPHDTKVAHILREVAKMIEAHYGDSGVIDTDTRHEMA